MLDPHHAREPDQIDKPALAPAATPQPPPSCDTMAVDTHILETLATTTTTPDTDTTTTTTTTTTTGGAEANIDHSTSNEIEDTIPQVQVVIEDALQVLCHTTEAGVDGSSTPTVTESDTDASMANVDECKGSETHEHQIALRSESSPEEPMDS